jgi:hypothetical protein
MKTKLNISHLLVAKLLLALALLTAAPMLLALDQFTLPFEETVVCQGDYGDSEEIYIEGTYRVLLQYVEGDDHTTSLFQVFWTGNALGLTSGAKYLLRGKWMELIQENPPFIFLWNDHFQLIGKGQAENFNIYFKIRIVENANGETTVDFIDYLQCVNV